MIKKQQLKLLLKEKIQKNFNQNDIFSLYLFGSYAWGTPNDTSDIDLLLVATDKNNSHVLVKKLYKSFADINQNIDILGYAKQALSKKIKTNQFLQKILTEGEIIYETRI